uniref:Uncharacterized protein n=1 Tax=Anopheles coluzzii TaxID=1518534 RepID=A0A8W7PTE9_ANOCL
MSGCNIRHIPYVSWIVPVRTGKRMSRNINSSNQRLYHFRSRHGTGMSQQRRIPPRKLQHLKGSKVVTPPQAPIAGSTEGFSLLRCKTAKRQPPSFVHQADDLAPTALDDALPLAGALRAIVAGGRRCRRRRRILPVRFRVLHHVVLPDEALAALLAGVRFRAAVQAHVPPQHTLLNTLSHSMHRWISGACPFALPFWAAFWPRARASCVCPTSVEVTLGEQGAGEMDGAVAPSCGVATRYSSCSWYGSTSDCR